MKKMQNYFAAAVIILFSASCNNNSGTTDVTTGDWTRKSEMNGVARSEAASFTIGNIAYVGTGYDGTYRRVDFWSYDPTQNAWSQETDYPGTARNSAVAFAIGTQGYVGTGYDGYNMLNTFYRYTPATKKWDSVATFAGSARYDAVGFGINNIGYVTTGYDGTYQKDFWQFDPSAGTYGTWTQKTSFGGFKRSAGSVFVYGTKAYLIGGSNNGTECGDLWYYDQTADAWVQERNIYNSNTTQTFDDDYTDIERDNAVSYVIGDSAFLVTGENGSLLTTTWSYNIAEDQWVRRSPIQVPRQGAVGFSLLGYGYFATGKSSSSTTGYLDDLVLFDPNKVLNTDDY